MKSMKIALAATSVLYSGMSFGQALPVSLPNLPTAAVGPVLSALPTLPLAIPSPTALPVLGGQGLPSLPGLGGGGLPALGGLPVGLPSGLPVLPSLPLALPSPASLPTLGGLGLPSLGLDGLPVSIPTGLPSLPIGAVPNVFELPGILSNASPVAIPTFAVLPSLQSFPSVSSLTGGAVPNLSGLVSIHELANTVPVLPNPEIIPGVLPANFDPKTTLNVVTRFVPVL